MTYVRLWVTCSEEVCATNIITIISIIIIILHVPYALTLYGYG